MQSAWIKLVAVLLLVAQGAIAFAPGRVICIPILECDTHQPQISACEHRESHGCAHHSSDDVPRHEHGPFNALMHVDDTCDCHLHVPIPSDEQLPGSPRSEGVESRVVFAPVLIAAISWNFNPPRAAPPLFLPPGFAGTDQVRALKSTRLLI